MIVTLLGYFRFGHDTFFKFSNKYYLLPLLNKWNPFAGNSLHFFHFHLRSSLWHDKETELTKKNAFTLIDLQATDSALACFPKICKIIKREVLKTLKHLFVLPKAVLSQMKTKHEAFFGFYR